MNLPHRRLVRWAGRSVSLIAAVGLLVYSQGPTYAQQIPPSISGLSTTQVDSGSTLTIYGSNFDWSIAAPDINDQVMLGSVVLPVESWSTTAITVMIPSDAESGTLTVSADNGTSAPVALSVAVRGILEVNQTGMVSALDGASLYSGPSATVGATAIVPTPDGSGYWVLDGNGTIQAFGDAKAQIPAAKIQGTAVDLAMNPAGSAGWVLSQTGVVTPVTSTSSIASNSTESAFTLPAGVYVGIAADATGDGYYALNKNGTVTGEGSAQGSWNTGVSAAAAIAADPDGGFWVLGENGSVVAMDGAPSYGNAESAIALTSASPAAIAATPDGGGYYIATSSGTLYAYGDAEIPNDIRASASPSVVPLTGLAVIGPYRPYGVEDLAYWYPTGNFNQYISYQNTMDQADNIISPHWYGVGANGTVGGPGSSIVNQVAEMQANGLAVVPMFGRTFNSNLGPLATVAGQDAIVSGIMNAVNMYHLNGANIDFEDLPDNSEDYLDAFAQKLRAALGPSRIMVFNVYPDWAPYINLAGQRAGGYVDSVYNYTELSDLSNYMVVMAYSLAFNPGPIASLTHDTGIIDYLLHGAGGTGKPIVDLSHVLLGIPGYGQTWEGSSGFGTGNSMTIPAIESMLQSFHVSSVYDPAAGEDYAHYQVPFSAPGATLSNGDTGTSVVTLQYGLSQVLANPRKFGAVTDTAKTPALPLAYDGRFGGDTEAAVQAFQIDFGITGDASGVYGSATSSKLAYLSNHYPQSFAPGVPATVWFDNAEADLAHSELAQANGLAGVSLWAMGEADPAYFTTLAHNTNVVANPPLSVSVSSPTLYANVNASETVTVTQGTGFPIANLNVSLDGQTALTNSSGQATFTVTPSTIGTDPVTVTDPSGQTVASTQVVTLAPSMTRIAGSTRYQTAIKLANSMFAEAHTVILTTSTNYPDALAGAPLATALGAPILLTASDSLTTATAREMRRLDAQRVVLLGGTAAISDTISSTLSNDGYTVTRYAGKTRFGTAAEIALALGGAAHTAVIANGDTFPGALSIAPIAANQGWPLLLANGQDPSAPLTASTLSALKSLKIQEVYLIGGTDQIPNGVASQLQALGIRSVRIQASPGQSSIYGTDLAVLNYFSSQISLAHIYMATGSDFPDALTAAPVAALSNSAVLLVPGDAPMIGAETSWLSEHRQQVGVADVVGGTSAIPQTYSNIIATALGLVPS